MTVFISHKKTDREIALQVLKILESDGIKCYFDELDKELRNEENITKLLMQRVKECTHLLAVVSGNTVYSWWVPFEIGVASNSDRRISTYVSSYTTLPEYLKIWPVMTKLEQMKYYIQYYKQDKEILLEKRAFSEANTAPIKSANDFHRLLKTRIGVI